jgi:hypothetical protein
MRRIGSGTVMILGILSTAAAMLGAGEVVGWDSTWRAFGVTPLPPPFFDMHVINDYAACVWKGVDAYAPHACNPDNFNIPPAWLWLGFLGISGADSVWMTAGMIAVAASIMVLLLRGRSWAHGVVSLAAIISPSVLMGVERGNLDLLILSLVGLAALVYEENNTARANGTIVILSLGVALKLIPLFCVALAVRPGKQTLRYALALATLSLIYLAITIEYIVLIRRNVPTTFILSYGYKTIFLGIDHLRSEARLSPLGLADTWVATATAIIALLCAAALAMHCFRNRRDNCQLGMSVAGTAFTFGAGIYCGTYLLGTNFVYRLMFLLLCLPQLEDWQENGSGARFVELGLLGLVLGVLWLNGNASGHSIFLLLPQLLDWILFFSLSAVLMLSLFRMADSWARFQSP